MAERSSVSDANEIELLILLPDHREVTYTAQSNCPMMDLLIQIASKENLKPSAHVLEALASSMHDEDHSSKPTIHYKPNTPIGMLNTQVIRLGVKNSAASRSVQANMPKQSKIGHSESFSNRVQNFNKMSGVSAVQICNDPDGFTKLSEDTKRIKSRCNFITSTLPPQVSGNWDSAKTPMNTFRLQIHLPYEQLHIIRASPEYTIQDVLDIIEDERSLKMERYTVFKTNEPELILNTTGTLKEYRITEMSLKLRPEFEVIRNVNPKKVKKENSSHFRSAFKSFFQQLKPSSRSNSVVELRPTTEIVRPKSEINRIHYTESSCESTGESSVGGSAPATLPRRCRLGPESASTINLAMEPALPTLRRGVSDMAVNKPKFPRRKRLAPKPPTPISAEELLELEDGLEEQVAAQKTEPTVHTVIPSPPTGNNMTLEIDSTDVTIKKINTILPDEQADKIDKSNSVEVNITNEIMIHTENITETDLQSPVEDGQSVKTDIYFPEEKVNNKPRDVHKEDGDEICIDKQRTPNGHYDARIETPLVMKPSTDHTIAEIKDNDIIYSLNNTDAHIEYKNIDTIQDVQLNIDEIIHYANPPDEYQDKFNISNNSSVNYLSTKEDIVAHNKVQNVNEDITKIKEMTHDEYPTVKAVNSVNITLKNTPPASHSTSYHRVESPVAVVVDTPELNATTMNSPTANNVNKSNCKSSPSLSKLLDNPRSAKSLPQRSISYEPTIASKPSVEQLMDQIKKIKQKAKEKQNHANYEYSSKSNNIEERVTRRSVEPPEIVDHIPKKQSLCTQSFTYNSESPMIIGSPSTCITPPGSPVSEDSLVVNGNKSTEKLNSRLVTDVVTKLYTIEKNINSEPAKSRPLPKFMLTSWAEEKRPPVVKRIADYGTRNSSTLVRRMSETNHGLGETVHQKEGCDRPTPLTLSATLQRLVTQPAETNETKTAPVCKPPMIINVIEKINPNKQMYLQQKENSSSHLNGTQDTYSKFNIYNMTPTILSDHVDSYIDDVNEGKVNILTKPSWELVKDASKKLEEGKLNGNMHISKDSNDTSLKDDVFGNNDFSGKSNNIVGKNIEFFGKSNDALKIDKEMENGKEQGVRHMYKYAKPLQFQLGTWSDKTKTLKIETEGNLENKSDPPLVTELDKVAVWSATY